MAICKHTDESRATPCGLPATAKCHLCKFTYCEEHWLQHVEWAKKCVPDAPAVREDAE